MTGPSSNPIAAGARGMKTYNHFIDGQYVEPISGR